MRLAFSVAAHLDPEILLVDEVLAVGDAEFQKKCLGKMGEVASEGRTVLFVSHNMAAVKQLCSHGMVLGYGKTECLGDVDAAIYHYTQKIEVAKRIELVDRKDREGSQWLTFYDIKFYDMFGNEIKQITSGQDIKIRFYYKSDKKIPFASVNIAFNVKNNIGYTITNLNSFDSGDSVQEISNEGFFQCEWQKFNLKSGSYDCNLFCSVNGETVDWIQSAFSIFVEDGDYYESGRIISKEQGDVLIPHRWSSHVH